MSETRTVTSVQARKSLLKAFKTRRPLFLWGPPGIGKSELVADLAEELGGHMIDLRLGQMEPTDIRGIPFYNKDLGKMDWAPPVELPDEELASQYPVVVLFCTTTPKPESTMTLKQIFMWIVRMLPCCNNRLLIV